MWGNQDQLERQQRAEYYAAQKELAEIKKENAKKPKAQKWDSLLGKDGMIKDDLKLNNQTDTRALEMLRKEGLRGPGEASAWRGLMDDKITRQAGDSMQQLGRAQQQGMDQMAMRGGASSGAAERMMQAGVGQNLANQQNIFGNRLQADLADEQNRQSGLQNLNQAELNFGNQNNQVALQNRNATQQEIFQKRAFDTNNYNEQMSAWAAEKTAKATPSGGGGKK